MGLKLGQSVFSKDISANRYVGVEFSPTITEDLNNNTITIEDDGIYFVFSEPQHRGDFLKIEPQQTTLSIDIENTTFYVFAEYINGNSTISYTQNIRKLADGNVAPIARVVKTGNFFHIYRYARLSLGLPEKINSFLEFSFGFTIISGLSVTVNGQDVTVGAGEVTLGVSITELPEVSSNDPDVTFFQLLRDEDGIFTWEIINELNNSQYQGPQGLVELSDDHYNVQWIWRGVEEGNHLYTIINDEEYISLEDAQNSPMMPVPEWVRDHSVPLAQVIYQKNAIEPESVTHVDVSEFDQSDVVKHNDLGGLQGGTANEYFHLTASEHNELVNHVGEGGDEQHPDVTSLESGFMTPQMLDELNNAHRDNYVLVKNEDDLPEASNGIIQLEGNTLYEFNGTVVLSNSLRYGTDTMIIGRHWFNDVLVYTGSGDAIISQDENLYMNNMTVSSPNGRAFSASSSDMTHELLLSFCAFNDCIEVGNINNVRAPGIVNVNISNYNNGITFEGEIDQIFLFGCPIRLGRENSKALVFDEALDVNFVDVSDCFFKNAQSGSIALSLHPSATINNQGLIIGAYFDDTIQATENFDQTTPGWDFQNNVGIPNSTITGKMFYSPIQGGPVETNIATQNQWVKMNIPTQGNQQERINVTTSNRLVYEGVRQARLQVITNWTGTPSSNNTQYQFAIAKNGTVDDSTVVPVFMRSTAQPQPVPISTILTLNQDDYIEVFVRNVDGTANISTHSIQVSINR